MINELEHNPAGTDTGNEWVELFNPTSSSVSLSGWSLSTTHGDTVQCIIIRIHTAWWLSRGYLHEAVV
ncbi:MAG: lamin tail domain-containing protein [Theionarchaea archaeon]|nr:lamin tail domain-containing protein [Theionarchaea archaeon]